MLGGVANAMDAIQVADPAKGQVLVAALDSSRLVRCIDMAEDHVHVVDVVRAVQEVDPAIAEALIQILRKSLGNAALLKRLAGPADD